MRRKSLDFKKEYDGLSSESIDNKQLEQAESERDSMKGMLATLKSEMVKTTKKVSISNAPPPAPNQSITKNCHSRSKERANAPLAMKLNQRKVA